MSEAEAPAPCEMWFYRLERTAPESVLADLLEKTLARGWRARVKLASREALLALDARLWTDRPERFLPHGLEEEPHAARQPVLLGLSDENPNGASALFLLDGAAPGPLDGYRRCVDLFDAKDEAALAGARLRWSAARRGGLPASYWRQTEAGRWEKQA